MKIIDLWMEGFRISGNDGHAQFLGTYKGTDFDDAVLAYKRAHGLKEDEGPVKRGEYWYNWGCQLFDNEVDARKSFG